MDVIKAEKWSASVSQAVAADQKVNGITHIFLKNKDAVPGILEQMIFEIPFSSFPADMIDPVTIDLEGLPAGTIEPQIKRDIVVLRIKDKKRALAPNAE